MIGFTAPLPRQAALALAGFLALAPMAAPAVAWGFRPGSVSIQSIESITVVPPAPTPDHQVNVVIVAKVWRNRACRSWDNPEPRVYRSGTEIHVDFDAQSPPEEDSPVAACADWLSSETVTVPVWQAVQSADTPELTLIAGHWERGELARKPLRLGSLAGRPLGGIITGAVDDPVEGPVSREIGRVTCRNLKTRKRTAGHADGRAWTCDPAGLRNGGSGRIETRIVLKPLVSRR